MVIVVNLCLHLYFNLLIDFVIAKFVVKIRGYQFRSPDAFPPLYNSNNSNARPSIENSSKYVEGVSNPSKTYLDLCMWSVRGSWSVILILHSIFVHVIVIIVVHKYQSG